jgi:hypothetical protein
MTVQLRRALAQQSRMVKEKRAGGRVNPLALLRGGTHGWANSAEMDRNTA